MSLKHRPMCFSWEGNKPLSHKESMNKVSTGLAVGINAIHPLLIVPFQLKGLAEGKGQPVKERQRNALLWVYKECLFQFYRINLRPARGHYPCVCVHLCNSEFLLIQTKAWCSVDCSCSVARDAAAHVNFDSCTIDNTSSHVRILITSLCILNGCITEFELEKNLAWRGWYPQMEYSWKHHENS